MDRLWRFVKIKMPGPPPHTQRTTTFHCSSHASIQGIRTGRMVKAFRASDERMKYKWKIPSLWARAARRAGEKRISHQRHHLVTSLFTTFAGRDRKQTEATGLLSNGRMFPGITQLRIYFIPEMFTKRFPSLRHKAQGSGRACVEF